MMKVINKETWEEFVQRIEEAWYEDTWEWHDGEKELLSFIHDSSFEEFLNFLKDYIEIKTNINNNKLESDFVPVEDLLSDFEEEYLLDGYSKIKQKVKFKLGVKFNSEKEIKLQTKYDGITVILTKNIKRNIIEPYFTVNVTNSSKGNKFKLRIYKAILEHISLHTPFNFSDKSTDSTNTFGNSIEIILDILNNENFNDEDWQNYSDKKKKQLLSEFIIFHMRFSVIIFSILTNMLQVDFHFNAVRKLPKYSYKTEKDLFNQYKFMDKDRNNYYGVLDSEVIPEKSMYDGNDFDNPFELINDYINTIGLGKQIFSYFYNNKGYIKFELLSGKIIDLADGPSGLLQLFPILAKLAYRKRTFYFSYLTMARISIEEPELHLHPKAQTQLLEKLSEYGQLNNLIVETHSEHLIRKIQVMFAEGRLTDEDVNIIYFNNKNGKTSVKKMGMDEDGNFSSEWPSGFFDITSNAAYELLNAQIAKQ